MYQLFLAIHVLIAVGLIGLVLVQQGKGAGMGAAFGSGASSTVFGAQGSGSFLMKITAVLATAFFITSLSLGYIASKEFKANRAQTIPVPATQQSPIPIPQAVPEQNAPVKNNVEEDQ